MASATIPIIFGIVMAGLVGWYYRSTADHALDTRRDQTWWGLKFGLIIVGGYAGGRWLGVFVNAQLDGVLEQTIATYPVVASASFLLFGFAVVHTLDEIVTGE